MNNLSHCTKEAQRLAQEMALVSSPAGSPDAGKQSRDAHVNLIESAARVLARAMGDVGPGIEEGSLAPEANGTIDDRLWELTCAVTRITVQDGAFSSVDEAAAALQALTCTHGESNADSATRIQTLHEIMGHVPGRIRVEHNGPCIVTNVLGSNRR